uniref:Secreted protein n=1 Tax=Anopheles culicifacies TaxID=139723 RepID=A0A182MTE5_9DIPT
MSMLSLVLFAVETRADMICGEILPSAAVCSLFSGISASVCKSDNQRAAAKACELRCHAKNFEEGKCVNDSCFRTYKQRKETVPKNGFKSVQPLYSTVMVGME